jgi:hypothetical protein
MRLSQGRPRNGLSYDLSGDEAGGVRQRHAIGKDYCEL